MMPASHIRPIVIVEAHGKVHTVRECLKTLGIPATVYATGGYLAGWPRSFTPLGLSLAPGRLVEHLRTPLPGADELRTSISSAVGANDAVPIILATDDDIEGDVIALDAGEIARTAAPGATLLRCFPGAMTPEGWRTALQACFRKGPVTLNGSQDSLQARAVEGRFRAAVDRWMGATFSAAADAPCGRVRAGLLAIVHRWTQGHDAARLPEIGELLFAARLTGHPGMTATARVPLHGPPNSVLRAVAERYSGGRVPGHAVPAQSAGAAIAPRFSSAAWHTADMLVHAGRQHRLAVGRTSAALQASYMAGSISYPRTDGRDVPAELARHLRELAGACGMPDTALASGTPVHGRDSPVHPVRTAHPALLPMAPVPRSASHALNLPRDDPGLVHGLVARRAAEICRAPGAVPAAWQEAGSGELSTLEAAALDALEWTADIGPQVPWSTMTSTGIRSWPVDTILVEGMVLEEIARPSTWASTASRAVNEGLVHQPYPYALPQLTPHGAAIRRRVARLLSRPEEARAIARALEFPFERPGADMQEALRTRLDALCDILPEPLLDGMARTLELPLAPAVQVRSPHAVGPETPRQSGMPQQPVDPAAASRAEDIGQEHDAGELGNRRDGAGLHGGVNGVDQGAVAPGVAPEQVDQDFEP